MKTASPFLAALAGCLLCSGCFSVKTESEIKPIHITMDINLKMQVDKSLDSFFGDLDAVAVEAPAGASAATETKTEEAK